jgi:HJR/Mrr/RecB family endonuclease
MPVLDGLSGFEFEDVLEDVFRNLGYENVRQAERTADEGRDILIEEIVDGTRHCVWLSEFHQTAKLRNSP